MITATDLRSVTFWMSAALLGLLLWGCTSPLDIDTPRRFHKENLDSVVTTESFLNGRKDSIFAYVDDKEVVFATEVVRPLYNGRVDGAYYITVSATRYGWNESGYEVMSLRLDGIRDTGVYVINAPYSTPKQIDPTAPRSYGARYDRKGSLGLLEGFNSGRPGMEGWIHVVKIDEERGVMVGTFAFIGYYDGDFTTVKVDRGAFRIYLMK